MSFFTSKITLRAYIVFTAFTSFVFSVVYIILMSDIDIKVRGEIDVAMLLAAFISLISVVIGWLFGKRA